MNFIMSYRDNEGNGVLKWLVCVLHERINFVCVGAKLGLLKANFGRWLVELWLLFLDARGFLVLHQGSAVADLIPHSETTAGPWCSGTYKGVLQQMQSCSVGKWTFKPILCFVEKETTWPCVLSHFELEQAVPSSALAGGRAHPLGASRFLQGCRDRFWLSSGLEVTHSLCRKLFWKPRAVGLTTSPNKHQCV